MTTPGDVRAMSEYPDSARLFDAASRRRAPKWRDGDRGRITPGKWTAILTIFFWIAFAALAFGVARSPAAWPMLALEGFLLLPALLMAPSLTHRHDVTWDGHGFTGASRMLGPTLGWRRMTIAWGECVLVGKTITAYWYVQAADGRRIYWSHLYPGYPVFVGQLARRCPHLDLSLVTHGV